MGYGSGKRVSNLIDGIYDAATEGDFARILQHTGEAIGAASGGVLAESPNEVRLLAAYGHSEESQREYVGHYGRLDPLPILLEGRAKGRFVGVDAWRDEPYAEKHELREDYLKVHDIRYLAVAKLHGAAGALTIGFQRGDGGSGFTDGDLSTLEYLEGHLSRAFRLALRLGDNGLLDGRARYALAALDAMPQAVLVADAEGRFCVANRAGESVLRDGSAIGIAAGRLLPVESGSALQFALAVRNAMAGVPRGCVLRSAAGEPLLAAMVSRLPQGLASVADGVLVILEPATRARNALPEFSALMDIFGLTRAEAQLTVALASGKTVADFAQERGVGQKTVRNQLAAVFQKTGVSRQTELVLLVSRLPECKVQ